MRFKFRKEYYLITISVRRIIIVRIIYAYIKLAYQALWLLKYDYIFVLDTFLVTKLIFSTFIFVIFQKLASFFE